MRSYRDALVRLHALARFGVRPGLAPIAGVLAALGHPEQAFPSLHIAGTNGKGSTAAFAERMLRAAGAHTGLYTSPHLSRFTERIRLDGQEIDQGRVGDLVQRVLDAPGGDRLTFFEVVTAMAFLAFAEARIDLAVIEVGLGGRLDATNLCRPFATVVTGVALDHMAELGATEAAIAVEKAGIAKSGVPLFVGPVGAEAARSIARVAAAAGAPISWMAGDGDLSASLAFGLFSYRGPGGALDGARLGLDGAHQAGNAALALAACSVAPGFVPDDRARREGLSSVSWPGRLESIAPDLLLDAAHNPQGAGALALALGDRRFTLLIGVLSDKDVDGVLSPLCSQAARVICTRPDSPRALPAAELAARVAVLFPSLRPLQIDDLAAALASARDGGLVVVAGSIFLIGAVRRLVTGEPTDPLAVADPLGQNL